MTKSGSLSITPISDVTSYDFRCDEQLPSSQRRTALQAEQDLKSDEQSVGFDCPRCDKNFHLVKYLIQHLREHQSDSDDVENSQRHIPSEMDPTSFTSVQDLTPRSTENSSSQRSSGAEQYKCSKCPYTVAIKSYLIRHERSRHTNFTRFKCLQCLFATNTEAQFMKHLIIHSESKKQFWGCTDCLFSTNNMSELSKHISQRNCAMCSYSTTCEFDHVKHQLTHRDEKPYCHSNVMKRNALPLHRPY